MSGTKEIALVVIGILKYNVFKFSEIYLGSVAVEGSIDLDNTLVSEL